MTTDQLAPFLQGSFLDGVARTIDLGGNLGVMDGNLIFDQFGEKAFHSDLEAINRDAVKSVGILFACEGK